MVKLLSGRNFKRGVNELLKLILGILSHFSFVFLAIFFLFLLDEVGYLARVLVLLFLVRS